MTTTNTILFTKSEFQQNCINGEQLANALCDLIDAKANYEAIELVANDIRQRLEHVSSQARFIDVLPLESFVN